MLHIPFGTWCPWCLCHSQLEEGYLSFACGHEARWSFIFAGPNRLKNIWCIYHFVPVTFISWSPLSFTFVVVVPFFKFSNTPFACSLRNSSSFVLSYSGYTPRQERLKHLLSFLSYSHPRTKCLQVCVCPGGEWDGWKESDGCMHSWQRTDVGDTLQDVSGTAMHACLCFTD